MPLRIGLKMSIFCKELPLWEIGMQVSFDVDTEVPEEDVVWGIAEVVITSGKAGGS
jgi:hypothetical protein